MHEVPGRLIITDSAMYFDPDPPGARELHILSTSDSPNKLLHGSSGDDEPSTKRRRRRRWGMGQINGAQQRWYRLQDSAMEVFLHGERFNECHFLHFVDCHAQDGKGGGRDVRDTVLRKLATHCRRNVGPKVQLPGISRSRMLKRSRIIELWQNRKISNFEYLMELNTMAGRSFNDLTQYPVFPWVISDYTSAELDLTDPSVYRDLTKPMGALNEDRLAECRERYETFDDEHIPPFMYGSHYSTCAGVVLYFFDSNGTVYITSH